MRINQNTHTISEIRDMMERNDLFVNRSYQRASGIWPVQAKSYFIDTVLEGYPFPKVYFYEVFDHRNRRPIREIVDGQQRISTLVEFLNNKFRLSSSAERYAGCAFDDLPEDVQECFLVTPVHADVILQAERSQLLEMFRRINAYTAPLNPAEKRHSQFQGEFKWFINELADRFSPTFDTFEILTEKQILRMSDAELLAEFSLVLDRGIINRDARTLNSIYKQYDDWFPYREEFAHRIEEFFSVLKSHFNPLRDTFLMKPYVIHSLFCAMMHRKYGIPGGQTFLGESVGTFFRDSERTCQNLRALAEAHEMQDTSGIHSEYVKACLSTTHRVAQRKTRTAYLLSAFV